LGIVLITIASRSVLGHTQPPIQWVPGSLSLGVNWPGREADHLYKSSAEVKECAELNLPSPNIPSWRRAQLKHRVRSVAHQTRSEHTTLGMSETNERMKL